MSTKAHSRTMNAAVYREYGSPGVLRHEEVAVPDMNEDTIMVGVRAAAINPADRFSVLGRPIVIRLVTGLTAPKRVVPGRAFAGVVEALGRQVSRFRVGDEVYGETPGGAYADKVAIREQNLGRKPANTTFEEAAAVPLAGVTALQGIRDSGRVQPGNHVLINGAAGGVGTLAIQIGKALGSEVTAVCSAESTEMVRSLGADHVVDYGQDDFTQNEGRYDVILDLVGNHPLTACRRVLTSTGTLVMSSGPPSPTLRRVVFGYLMSPLGSNRITSLMAMIEPKDLDFLTELIEAGKVTPVIDQVFDLDEISDAFRHVNKGHARGRTVVRMNAGN